MKLSQGWSNLLAHTSRTPPTMYPYYFSKCFLAIDWKLLATNIYSNPLQAAHLVRTCPALPSNLSSTCLALVQHLSLIALIANKGTTVINTTSIDFLCLKLCFELWLKQNYRGDADYVRFCIYNNSFTYQHGCREWVVKEVVIDPNASLFGRPGLKYGDLQSWILIIFSFCPWDFPARSSSPCLIAREVSLYLCWQILGQKRSETPESKLSWLWRA